MAGFLKKISAMFSGGSVDVQPEQGEEYEGFMITPAPIAEGGQFRLCGTITKDIGGEQKEHKFIRADVCQSKTQANELALIKGKQMIDQLGERVFNN